MKPPHRIGRREFLRNSTALVGAAPALAGAVQRQASGAVPAVGLPSSDLPGGPSSLQMRTQVAPGQTIWIVVRPEASFQEQLAARELARGLRNLGFARQPVQAAIQNVEPRAEDFVFSLRVNSSAFQHPEAYEIARQFPAAETPQVRLSGATPQAVLYGVFDFLERQGAFFGLDGEIYPLQPQQALALPAPHHPWRGQPRFGVRGLVPWPDFLNCITVFNREDLRAYLEAMLRMRFNTLGVHVYSGADQWTESFLSFEYGGVGHLAFTDTTATNRWGYLPERTSRYGMGAADFYAGEVFGSDATTKARNCWEAQELAQQLWSEAFRYAKVLGIRTGVGFEPYQIPDEIFRATPPEARYEQNDSQTPGPRLDPDSAAARDILEARLGALLEAYPTVDHVWLWEDESMSWASQKAGVPLSVTPFRQAHDFLRRHAPDKRLVISGWGGVVRHFEPFHRALPGDIIFSSLSDNLGWDPVSEEFAKVEGRERWPIPWLEDDPAMWLPQSHLHRFVRDMDRAEQFGCQGLLGIHWRHRITDANAGFQSRYSWDKELQPADHYRAYARALVRQPIADDLAQILDDTDCDRRLLCSFTGEIKDGHHQIHEYSGDYNEAFQFWNGYEPPQEVKQSQAEVARQLRSLANSLSGAEHERLNYITRHVEFLVPYAESWSLAFHLHQILQKAAELKKRGEAEEARKAVLRNGVPVWLKLAPLVREALLDFQEIVSTRNDLGTLASMHNKYERLALTRLRASMKEFLGELPEETERLFENVRQPDPSVAPRVFVPARPTVLETGEKVRIFAVAPGGETLAGVTLHIRAADSSEWEARPMRLAGRRTFSIDLEASRPANVLFDYYVEAEFHTPGGRVLATAPPEAPGRFYTATLT